MPRFPRVAAGCCLHGCDGLGVLAPMLRGTPVGAADDTLVLSGTHSEV